MEIVECEREPFDVFNKESITLLPEEGDGVRSGAYSSTAISLVKELNKVGVKTVYLNPPDRLLEQRSAEWFGPALLFFTSLYNANPDIFSIVLGVVERHVRSLYPSSLNPNVRLNINIQRSKAKTVTSVSYEGGVEGLGILAGKLEAICRNEER